MIEEIYQFLLKSGVTLDSHADDIDCLENEFWDRFGTNVVSVVHDDWFHTHCFDHNGQPCRLIKSDLK